MKTKQLKIFRAVILMLFVSLTFPVNSATIARIGTEELVNKAELIFEGVVINSRSEFNEKGYIYTYVDFLINDVYTGNLNAGSTLTLRFTGGTVGDTQLDVGVITPKLNERGIYFVEQVAPGLINPLLGWKQGHFTVNNEGSVVAGNNQTVEKIERRMNGNNPQQYYSKGVASGIITTPHPSSIGKKDFYNKINPLPMSKKEFKRKIIELKK